MFSQNRQTDCQTDKDQNCDDILLKSVKEERNNDNDGKEIKIITAGTFLFVFGDNTCHYSPQ